MREPKPPQEQLIVALDGTQPQKMMEMVKVLGDRVLFYKVGWHSFCRGGFEVVSSLVGAGKRVFLDGKLFDIDSTVAAAVEGARTLGVEFLTVHAQGSVVRVAARAAQAAYGSSPKILAVTVLTSLGQEEIEEIEEMGYRGTVEELVCARAKKAWAAGAAGVICGPQEVQAVRAATSESCLIVTPGIRPEGAPQADQRRTGTPRAALEAGADYLVVGRPITQGPDPGRAVEAILDEMAQARV